MVTAIGKHRAGATSEMTQLVYEHGVSIAGTKKVMLEERFTMMMALWVPPGGDFTTAQVCRDLESDAVAARLGFGLKVEELDPGEPRATDEVVKRRFKLSCPQKPGIVLAITELLRDHGCAISEIDADTMARGSEIWLELECIVEVPAGVRVETVEDGLRFWTTSKDDRASVVFDGLLPTLPLTFR